MIASDRRCSFASAWTGVFILFLFFFTFFPYCGRIITSRTCCKLQLITFTFVLLQTMVYLNRKRTHRLTFIWSRSLGQLKNSTVLLILAQRLWKNICLFFFFCSYMVYLPNFVRKLVAVLPCSFVARISSYVLIVDMFTREFNNNVASLWHYCAYYFYRCSLWCISYSS